MVTLVKGLTNAEAWLRAVRKLDRLAGRTAYGLIIEVDRPLAGRNSDQEVQAKVDQFLRVHDRYGLETIAETIFPLSHYDHRTNDPTGVFETYPNETYPAIMKRKSDCGWGRYAYRLVRRVDLNGNELVAPNRVKDGGEFINPLRRVVAKMKEQFDGKTGFRQAYEIDVSDSLFELAVYDSDKDRNKYTQLPCLSHISLKVEPTNEERPRVHLTAVYRSQYFVDKALGNLLGLSNLLFFVCRQASLKPGTLVCHATYAQLDAQAWKLREVRALLDECEALYAPVDS